MSLSIMVHIIAYPELLWLVDSHQSNTERLWRLCSPAPLALGLLIGSALSPAFGDHYDLQIMLPKARWPLPQLTTGGFNMFQYFCKVMKQFLLVNDSTNVQDWKQPVWNHQAILKVPNYTLEVRPRRPKIPISRETIFQTPFFWGTEVKQ